MLEDPRTFLSAQRGPLAYWRWFPHAPTIARGSVVFLHGWGDHGARNHELATLLAEHGFACFAPDFWGHGHSPGPRAQVHRFETLLDDLTAFLAQAAPVRPLFLFGHSMGGCLAAHFAVRFPDALDGLILSGAALAVHPDVSRLKRWASHVLGRLSPRLSLGALNSPAHMARTEAAQQAYARDPLIHHGPIDAGTALSLLRANAWLQRHAPALQTPFLALQGAADALVAPAGPEQLRMRAKAQGSVVLYPDARHDLVLDLGAPRVLRDALAWLQRQPGVSSAPPWSRARSIRPT